MEGLGLMGANEMGVDKYLETSNVDKSVEPASVVLITGEPVLPDGTASGTGEGDKSSLTPENSDEIGMYVIKAFEISRDARRNAQEDILLDAERAYNNKYDMPAQSELATREQESGDSTIWVPYTRTKTNIAVAKTYEKMLNAEDHPWAILPDELTKQELEGNRLQVSQAKMAGVLQEPFDSALQKLTEYDNNLRSDKCDGMQAEIAQQMNKGGVFKNIARTILQQHYLGLGIAKFEISVRKEETWTESFPGFWQLTETEEPFPITRFIDLFDVFFDPFALDVGSSMYVIERHVMKRSGMQDLKSGQDFDEEKIRTIIKQNPTGNHIDLDYETTIRGINDQDQNNRGSEGYYDVYEYWGEIAGDKLMQYGMEEFNGHPIIDTMSYNMQCWVCANQSIKLVVNPHKPQKIPYFAVPYQENTHTIYATGIPQELFGIQAVINDVTRATIDNAAFSHGPMVEINTDMLASGQSPPEVLKPRMIFLREGGDAKEEMVRFYQPTENSQVLFNVYEMFNTIGEDATGIASSSEESLPSANSPNGAVSMTMSQKNILQRTVVSNIDTYLIKPLVEMYYNFNMEWNSNNDIKVPAHVTANGVTSVIAKEMRSQQLMAFAAATNNEIDSKIVNRKEVLSELVTTLDQDDEKLIYSDSEAKANNQASQQQAAQAAEQQQQGVIAQINAENEGELQQDQVKGEQAYQKQMLIEKSKMMQILAKEDADITSQEWDLLKQMQLNRQQQSMNMRNTAQNAQNTNQSAILASNLAQQQQQSQRPQQGGNT